MKIPFRSQRLIADQNGQNIWETQTKTRDVDPKKCALILCDVWDRHWSAGANARLAPLLPRIDALCRRLRKEGVFILHAPSDTLAFYEDSPARKRMASAPRLTPKIERNITDMPMPVDASDGGSDTNELPEQVNRRVWTRQHEAIWIDPDRDGISDDGAEVYSYFKANGIEQVFIAGVHTNMCILNRSFAIKNLVRWGFDAALVRDLTDCMYNPAMPPYVSHEEGLSLVIGYIEKFWCPTVSSDQLA